MKHCSKCGKELMDEAVICPGCGCPQEGFQQKQTKDSSNPLWFVISFLYWFVGLILFAVWKEVAPKKAKLCLAGALTALIVSIIIIIFVFVPKYIL